LQKYFLIFFTAPPSLPTNFLFSHTPLAHHFLAQKHVFRKCTATERLIGGRLDWSHDPVQPEPPEEEFVHVDVVSELPELDHYGKQWEV